MARKPRSEWTEAYRKRIERAEAAGKTRQQARGHKVREHVIRRQREKWAEASGLGLSTAHKKAIRDYLRRLPDRRASTEESVQLAYGAVLKNGWDWFVQVRDTRAQFIRDARRGTMPGSGYWDAVLDQLGLQDDVLEFLLYYHG